MSAMRCDGYGLFGYLFLNQDDRAYGLDTCSRGRPASHYGNAVSESHPACCRHGDAVPVFADPEKSTLVILHTTGMLNGQLKSHHA